MSRKIFVNLPFVLIILSFSLVVAVKENAVAEAKDVDKRAIYFALPSSTSLLSTEDIEREDLFVVASMEDLKAAVATNRSIDIIYLHPDAVNNIDNDWLQQQYARGLVIAALNTPISFLATKLSLEEIEVDDLNMEQSFGRLGVTTLRLWNVPGVLEGYAYFSEFLPDFHAVSSVANRHILGADPLNLKVSQDLAKVPINREAIFMGYNYWWDCCGGRLVGNTVSSSYTDSGVRIYEGLGISTYNPAPSTADTIHVYLVNSNNCGGWHTIFQGGFTALNSNLVNSGYQIVGSDQCPNPVEPNQVTGKIRGSTHYVQEYNPVSGSTVEWITIPLN
jgi:hypothetical protein